MALNIFELFGTIAIDSSGAKLGLDNTVKHAKNAEGSLAKTFKRIGTMVAAAFSVNAIVDFGKQCTQAYANIAAEESAFAQIMGDYADTAQAKLDKVADSTGVTSTRMTGAMTSLTAKFKGLGYDVEDATTLASDGLLIAADAAAFWDMSLEESMSHLNSFINGSYEGGEAIGLFANDTQMAAFAVEQGIIADTKAWAALDEAQRQATRLLYAKNMMEASGATGQAAKESQAYANVMANLKESWRQFQGVIGKPLLEKVVLPALQKLNNFLPNLTESVYNSIAWIEESFDKIKSYFDDVFTEDGINIDALPDAMTNMFRDMGENVGGLLSDLWQKIRTGASTLVANVVGAITGNKADAEKIGGVFSDLFGIASEVVIGVKDNAIAVFDWFLQNGEIVAPIIAAVATSMGLFVLAHPAIAVITALSTLIGAMTIDWADFESNYPHLVELFEDLTGLDFTNVANSLGAFQEGLQGIVTWFAENEEALNTLLVVLGGIAMYTGHYAAGTALIMAGGYDFLFGDAEDGNGTGLLNRPIYDEGYFTNNELFKEFDKMYGDGNDANGREGDSYGVNENEHGGGGRRFGEPSSDNGEQSLVEKVSAIATSIQETVDSIPQVLADGFNGITITGEITTGDVMLNTGVLVGTLTPTINLRLGQIGAMDTRG